MAEVAIEQEGVLASLAVALNALADTQRAVVNEHIGPRHMDPTRDNVRQYAFALIHEVGELADELGWKDWKPVAPANPERLADELADILAFLGILVDYVMQAGDLLATDLALAYRNKVRVNIERFNGRIDGYGVLQPLTPGVLRSVNVDHMCTLIDPEGVRYHAKLTGLTPGGGLYELDDGKGEVRVRSVEADGSWRVGAA